MDSTSKHGWSEPRPAERKGSVRRAREMLEVGKRPRIRAPQENAALPPGPRMSQQTAWPLLGDDGPGVNVVDSRDRGPNLGDSPGRLMAPRAPPPPRPPRQDPPSPSVYSERSVPDAVPSPLHLNNRNRAPSFSQPFVNQQHIHPALREPVPSTKEDPFRKSAASSLGSIPSIPDFPPPLPSQNNAASLAPTAPMRSGMNRRSSVSPIPEELPDSPTILNKPYTRLTASSWNSEQQESEVLGAYMDNNSEGALESPEHAEVSLVRQASVGTRGKPSLRTISKPSADGMVGGAGRTETPIGQTNDASLKEVAAGLSTRNSFSSGSFKESDIDPEKPPIVLENDTNAQHSYDNDMRSVEKETAALPQRTPTMSEMRPGARRPPRLNINAVREAEARGSLTSLSDLIKRATKLATNLEHGRTASRNDLLNVGGSRHPFGDPNRRSGSIKDILASFPNPAATPEGRSSWPVFWRRSTLQQLNSQEQGQDLSQEKGSTRTQRRRCCGMPLWAFITACVVLLLIIAAAVLIPIFLVVVPRENKGNDSSNTMCEKTNPCSNGGVSVSSGNVCSCVCVNGYTGSRCTTSGDASCVTTEITQNSTSRNATVGDDLPRLFRDSQSNFSIPLDAVTIMALFSQNNVSCTTENALVSFKGLSSNDNKRRALNADLLVADPEKLEPSSSTDEPTATIPVRREVATKNGILFEDSGTNESPAAAETSSASTSEATPAPTSAVTAEALDFSRISVLYILEKTGTLDAAMFSADVIKKHLEHSYSNSSDESFVINLVPSGIKGNITLDYGGFTITDFDGNTVGGS
ncbi:hypothetical protein AN4767.2 [Aspergillus nidulans FGSC A4]|uniref:EGF-like domain-containing protein n=1 Tax=Emericella nidulans (strain FGSC A4 / ATCC 38163 / CBS 112.46 / NRRL 194 / M139) TaxID=227321 RepID=Q5B3W3_EMENI|nr:hypothetical protein [Aspergillus nidulans FGSC A4]EAA60809.1 hypothetical protein AN4767.2 [Aspergillus nidulans FGSC A4]CBF76828.1 TPA: conserved hypothetical protein [Aspergillus nidulans FGSC A4]|eukprot:XP_662371.1 hypothetical protein AN4767.2 [Aspergillus nidulans FGSC A4]